MRAKRGSLTGLLYPSVRVVVLKKADWAEGLALRLGEILKYLGFRARLTFICKLTFSSSSSSLPSSHWVTIYALHFVPRKGHPRD